MARRPTLHGRELSADELTRIRREVESFGNIETLDDDMRALIEDHMPDLVRNCRRGRADGEGREAAPRMGCLDHRREG